MTRDELIPILKKHENWLNNEEGGERANLHEANLRGADLYGADLREANLRGADLYGANLHEANLHEANLRGVNLHEANLHEADLRGADLREANMRGADLYGANLQGAKTLDLITAGPIGSRQGITIFNIATDEIQCGCFRGTLDEFSNKVEVTHAANTVYLAEYRAAIEFFKAVKAAREGVERHDERQETLQEKAEMAADIQSETEGGREA